MAISSLEASKKLCELSNWTMTHLKVHKILYIANMVYLGRNKKPLINENFEAWTHGPVLPGLYDKLKIFSSLPIPSYVFSNSCIDKVQKEEEVKALEEAWEKLKNKEAWELVAITHRKKGAWIKHYQPYGNNLIPNESILKEYEDVITER